jgi:hypothetical protein
MSVPIFANYPIEKQGFPTISFQQSKGEQPTNIVNQLVGVNHTVKSNLQQWEKSYQICNLLKFNVVITP